MSKPKRKYPCKCESPHCHGVATKAGHSPYCAKCRTARWKAKYPLHVSFQALRKRAKERGHAFTLSREFYIAWAEKTEYAKYKGKTTKSLSVDRKNRNEGYHEWNIEAITLRENSRKEHVAYWREQQYKPDEQDIKNAEAAMAAQMDIEPSYES
jgi:hypothetical protein